LRTRIAELYVEIEDLYKKAERNIREETPED
jgi:hypothetical protein